VISTALFESRKNNQQIDVRGWAKLAFGGAAEKYYGGQLFRKGLSGGKYEFVENLLHFRREIRTATRLMGAMNGPRKTKRYPAMRMLGGERRKVNGKPSYLATVTLNFSTNDSYQRIERCDPLAPETWLSGWNRRRCLLADKPHALLAM
jgi:hypothetical protein